MVNGQRGLGEVRERRPTIGHNETVRATSAAPTDGRCPLQLHGTERMRGKSEHKMTEGGQTKWPRCRGFVVVGANSSRAKFLNPLGQGSGSSPHRHSTASTGQAQPKARCKAPSVLRMCISTWSHAVSTLLYQAYILTLHAVQHACIVPRTTFHTLHFSCASPVPCLPR